ncbi:hypothetical protein V2J09_020706 [Rumex salicifolius]
MDHHTNDVILTSKATNGCSFPISMNQHHQSEEMLINHDQESSIEAHMNSLLCSLSILKGKVNEVHSMATSSSSSSSVSFASLATLIQEIVVTASSMMFNCQQMALGSSSTTITAGDSNTLPISYAYEHHPQDGSKFHLSNNKVYAKKSSNDHDDVYNHDLDNRESRGGNIHQGQASTTFVASNEPAFYWYNDAYNNNSSNTISTSNCTTTTPTAATTSNKIMVEEPYDIIEIDAVELLAKYTHYCQVCGKGFKRDANLRMHMRAHGDEYKSSAALSNPFKNIIKDGDFNGNDKISSQGGVQIISRKYSCPQEGCRWNKKHAKFQPLKSMICVKNHYKRSHCPKMYVCNRCNRKQFSVLSDLKTHEKHCGDLRWRCSCGNTFSRKDKLMGHVSLFVGHSPVGLPSTSVAAATAI